MSSESLKKLVRYKASRELQIRKLCSSYEPHTEENECTDKTKEEPTTNSPTKHERINESNNLEL